MEEQLLEYIEFKMLNFMAIINNGFESTKDNKIDILFEDFFDKMFDLFNSDNVEDKKQSLELLYKMELLWIITPPKEENWELIKGKPNMPFINKLGYIKLKEFLNN